MYLLAQAETASRSWTWQNVVDARGIELTLTGMTIVFLSLILVSVSIALLPRILEALKGILPAENEGHHSGTVTSTPPGQPARSRLRRIAAIGYALHHRQGGDESR